MFLYLLVFFVSFLLFSYVAVYQALLATINVPCSQLHLEATLMKQIQYNEFSQILGFIFYYHLFEPLTLLKVPSRHVVNTTGLGKGCR